MGQKKKLYISTTIALSFIFFKGQPRLWSNMFHVCALSAERDRLVSFAKEEGIGYKYLPMRREISLWADLRCLLMFIWIFIKDRPYIVHGNTPKASLLTMVAAWITRRPVRIYMCHGLRYQGAQGGMRRLLMLMERITCSSATHVISVSKGVADKMIADGLCNKEKMHVIGYGSAGGVDTDKYNPETVKSTVRRDLNIPEDAIVYSFVGRIVKDKGVNELVNAFDKISRNKNNVHLLLVGPIESKQNPVNAETLELINNNTHIHLVGMQNDVRPFLKASNVFVLPSYREGFGTVLIEAGSMGLPCITTNITGCNEIIVHGENGSIIEPKDEKALFDEMEEYYSNPIKVENMAQRARRMVVERYECHKVWNQYYDFYQSL